MMFVYQCKSQHCDNIVKQLIVVKIYSKPKTLFCKFDDKFLCFKCKALGLTYLPFIQVLLLTNWFKLIHGMLL